MPAAEISLMCLSNIQVQLIEFRSFCEEDVDEILAFELENREYFERWFSRKHDVHDCGQLLIHEICQPGNIRQYEHSFIVRYLGRIIGRTTLHAIDRVVANSAAMEYCVAERFSGCGIATIVVAKTVRFAFDQLALWRVDASVRSDNTPSIRVLQKCNFQYFSKTERRFPDQSGKKIHDFLHFSSYHNFPVRLP